ncbi:quinone oxidoreductase family protein [Mycobacterium xenopi 4042]|uniref:malate dehydrogenase (quinone) n=1 Tax=Mycobacterium xenopi 4042 TaxID=1299334 RepID=X8E9H5_MYCXE|nr:quinone oxidoreductase family protein [Mycobacterium xenopi 4042]
MVNGKPWLAFGPFAGWSPKFLKHGCVGDLPRSLRPANAPSMLRVGIGQRHLVGYLLGQLALSQRARIDALREFVPGAVDSDWETTVAGQRVQVIRRGRLEFDTTVVSGADGSIAGLLGASPGRRPRCRPCWRCCSAALPTAIGRGCPRSKRWCRRWASPCRVSRRCSRRCGRGARRCWAYDGRAAPAWPKTSTRRPCTNCSNCGWRCSSSNKPARIRSWTDATCSPKPAISGCNSPTAR